MIDNQKMLNNIINIYMYNNFNQIDKEKKKIKYIIYLLKLIIYLIAKTNYYYKITLLDKQMDIIS